MGYLNFPVHVAFLKETLFWIIAFESRPTGRICFAASQSKVQMKRRGLAKRRNSYCSLWQPLLSVLQLRGLKGFCVVVCILLCVFFFAASVSGVQESECCSWGINSSSFTRGFWGGGSVKGFLLPLDAMSAHQWFMPQTSRWQYLGNVNRNRFCYTYT